MDPSNLAKLSPELRNQIYHLVLQSPNLILRAEDIKTYSGLTQTCRRIRSETLVMLYSLNSFEFTTSNKHIGNFCAFLSAIGPVVVPHLSSLRLLIVEVVPCKGRLLQCSQHIELRGVEAVEAGADGVAGGGGGKFHAISPTGAEAEIYQTLVGMGLGVRGRGPIWYTRRAVWYVGVWEEVQERRGREVQWLKVT